MADRAPRLHFRPEIGLFGDPKPFYWNDRYHVFFQNSRIPDRKEDETAMFAGMRWAHIVSDDLLRWSRLEDALVPTAGGPDAYGCWTGSVIRFDGRFHIFYTGVAGASGAHQTVCHATSDDLISWQKDPANPVVVASAPFATGPYAAWRDPQVFARPEGGFGMLLTADLPDAPIALRGCIARLTSEDLDSWQVAAVEHHPATVHRCECPDSFELNGMRVLLYSDYGVQVRTASGDSEPWHRPDVAQLDHFRYYAAKTVEVEQGRRLMFGFVFSRTPKAKDPSDDDAWAWGGSMALPRELYAGPDASLRVRPIVELERLRAEQLQIPETTVRQVGRFDIVCHGADSGKHATTSIEGKPRPPNEQCLGLVDRHPLQFELSLDFVSGSDASMAIAIGCDLDMSRGYLLHVDLSERKLALRRVLPVHNADSPEIQHLALPPNLPDPLPVRLFLDGSLAELFVADRITFSTRMYDLSETDNWWGLTGGRDGVEAHQVRAWRLSNDRL